MRSLERRLSSIGSGRTGTSTSCRARPQRNARCLLALTSTLVPALTLAPREVAADTPVVAERRLQIIEGKQYLQVSGSFTDAFDEELLAGLSSGFPTVVLLRSYVYPTHGSEPLAFTAATFRVVYDLWEEVYQLEIEDLAGKRRYQRATRAEALKDMTTMVQFPVAPLASIPTGQLLFVAIVVEVNPVSEQLIAEVRRWLSRRKGSLRPNGSFFGSFVSVFVNPKIDEAERTLSFRSQLFSRAKK
ncbi:MAG: hypothetical protein V2A73_19035 [Pseudomonadota bacterium]